MRNQCRSITWQGQSFHFKRLQPKTAHGEKPLWAVSRGREFIGTMRCPTEVSTREFDIRGLRWLDELLGHRPGMAPSALDRH